MDAASEESRRSFWFSHQIEILQNEQKFLAPACIDSFISELWQLETDTRKSVRVEVRDTKKNVLTDQYSHRYELNIKAIEKRVNAIRAARKEAEALRLESLPEDDIIARLEKLKAELPSVDGLEVTIIPVPDTSKLRRKTW